MVAGGRSTAETPGNGSQDFWRPGGALEGCQRSLPQTEGALKCDDPAYARQASSGGEITQISGMSVSTC